MVVAVDTTTSGGGAAVVTTRVAGRWLQLLPQIPNLQQTAVMIGKNMNSRPAMIMIMATATEKVIHVKDTE